jgi:hypothetical protein
MPQIKIPRETRIAKLHEISKLKMVETRLLELAVKYLVKATINFNPIIIQTLKEYERFSGGRELEIQTLPVQISITRITQRARNKSPI